MTISKKTFLNVLTIALIITVSTILAHPVYASTLELLGIGWNKSNLTVLIKPAKRVSAQAVIDVATAVSEWDSVLSTLAGAPRLTLVSGVKSADIIIHMKVGGGSVLGYSLPKTVSPFSCELKNVHILLSGKAFGQNLSNAGTRNVSRHELGHALGLGHSDDPDDLMYAMADSSDIFGDVDVLISDCDYNGIDAIHPLPANCEVPDSISCS